MLQNEIDTSHIDLSKHKESIRKIMLQPQWTPREVSQAKYGPKDQQKKHSAAASKAFLAKLSEQGFGIIVRQGSKPFVFKRKNLSDMNEAQKKLCSGN